MSKIDWSYHRPGCKACQKAQDFFHSHSIVTLVQVDAKKQKLTLADALSLADQADRNIAAKGPKVVRFNMSKDKPRAEVLKAVLLGPTGNLRSPTFRVGKTLVVGFHDESYCEDFGKD